MSDDTVTIEIDGTSFEASKGAMIIEVADAELLLEGPKELTAATDHLLLPWGSLHKDACRIL